MDQVKHTHIEDDDQIININLSILDEPTEWVVRLFKHRIDKNSGKSETKLIYREVIRK